MPRLWVWGLVCLGCTPNALPPSLLAVEPPFLDGAAGGLVTVRGEGLLPQVTVDFDRPEQSTLQSPDVRMTLVSESSEIELVDVTWVDTTTLTARVPAGVPLGLYDLHVVAPRGQELVLSAGFEVLDCSDGDCPLPDGGVNDAGVVACAGKNYRDRDLDGFGSGSARGVCGVGWAPAAGDCDDRDSLTNPLGVEVCNGLDDDCDGATDEDRCSEARWAPVSSGLGGVALQHVASFEPGGLWLTGGGRVFVRRGALGVSEVTGCPADAGSVAVASGSRGQIAGAMSVAIVDVATNTCRDARVSPGRLVSVTSLGVAGADSEFFGVLANGQLFHWTAGTAPVAWSAALPTGAEVSAIHGSSTETLMVVGSALQGSNRRAAAWSWKADAGWAAENLGDVGTQRSSLRAVWVMGPTDVVVVGDDGLVGRKTWAGWRKLDADSSSDLTSVRGFSTGRFFVTQSDGRVRRRARNGWQTLFRTDGGTALNDLSGTSEEDLWAVGQNGVLAHGPLAP